MQIIMYLVRRLARYVVLVAADFVVMAIKKYFFRRTRFLAQPMTF